MKKTILTLILLFLPHIAKSHHNDQDYTCEDVSVVTNYYSGWASCHAFNSSTNQLEYLDEYILPTTTPVVTLNNFNFTLSCDALVPFSHSVTTTQQVCTHTPREPYVSNAAYEYGVCSYYTRQGIILWENKPAATSYQVQEKVGTSWADIYNGTFTAMNYSKQPGTSSKSYQLRVRAKNSSQTGSWYNFNVYVPSCWNGAGPAPH